MSLLKDIQRNTEVDPDPVQRIINALDQRGLDPKPCGSKQWESKCPVHQGEGLSLKISEGREGKALLKCWSEQCKPKSIMEAIGLTESDMFVTRNQRPPAKKAPHPKACAAKVHPTPEAAIASTVRKLGQPTASWTYRDAAGDDSFWVYRFDPTGERKQFRPVHPTNQGWAIGDPPGLLPLYRLPELAGADLVFVTEGEKCAELARGLGLVTTTSAHGAQSVRKTDWAPLAGKRLFILHDLDSAGDDYTKAVVLQVAKLEPRTEVTVVSLPGLSKKGDDIEQFIQKRKEQKMSDEQIRDEIMELAASTAPVDLDQDPGDDADDEEALGAEPADKNGREKPGRKPAQADIMIGLAESATLFHTSDGKAYASIPVADHREHHAVRGTVFKQWLEYQFYSAQGSSPSSEAMKQAVSTLDAKARFAGDEEQVYLRVAEVNGPERQAYYLNLADKQGRAVKITSEGWEVITNPPVKFLRNKTMLPLSEPEQGGSVEDLRDFINVGTEQEQKLFVATLCAYLKPTGPYPILVIQGEQGSAKSTATRIVSRLTDPIDVFRGTIRNEHDLMIAAKNSWVVTSDNLSGLQAWLSDALCRVATGAGQAFRELYSNDEETIFKAMRPIVLNGIDDIAERPDLADRSVVLHLLRIPSDKRLSEQEFWGRFNALAPKILGALLNAVAGGLSELPNVRVERAPRMADFALWGEAVGRGLGWKEGAFLEAYEQNLSMSKVSALEACPVASAVCQFANTLEWGDWDGPAAELLKELNKIAGPETTRSNTWPKLPNKLSNKLRRAAPALLGSGVAIDFGTSGKQRNISIRKVQPEKENNVSSVPSAASPENGKHVSANRLLRNDDSAMVSSSIVGDRRQSSATSQSSVFHNSNYSKGLGDSFAGNADGPDDTDDKTRPSSGWPHTGADVKEREETKQWNF